MSEENYAMKLMELISNRETRVRSSRLKRLSVSYNCSLFQFKLSLVSTWMGQVDGGFRLSVLLKRNQSVRPHKVGFLKKRW